MIRGGGMDYEEKGGHQEGKDCGYLVLSHRWKRFYILYA